MKKLVPTVLALVVMFAAVRLAIWQLERAEFKQDLLSDWEHAPSLTLQSVDGDTPRFARVEGQGRFDGERHILLDNQTLQGRHGIHVYTPFRLESGERVFLVNRGWMPASYQDGQRVLPREIPTPAGTVGISGILNDPPRVGIQLGRADALDAHDWPNLMTYLEIDRVREVLGPEVDERIIQLNADHSAGFEGRDWPVVNMGPERHRAYAFQWFLIALAVFVIWVVLFVKGLGARN